MRRISIAVALLVGVWTMGTANAAAEKVKILDLCDPTTFNANPPTGPGLGIICDVNFDGDVTFAEFSSPLFLSPAGFGYPAWRFDKPYLDIEANRKLKVKNEGGEDHTFTEVAQFGGGSIDLLNEPLRLTAVPECPKDSPPGIIHPGETVQIKGLSAGVHLFQCCIHPWMHAVIDVESEDKDHKHHGHD